MTQQETQPIGIPLSDCVTWLHGDVATAVEQTPHKTVTVEGIFQSFSNIQAGASQDRATAIAVLPLLYRHMEALEKAMTYEAIAMQSATRSLTPVVPVPAVTIADVNQAIAAIDGETPQAAKLYLTGMLQRLTRAGAVDYSDDGVNWPYGSTGAGGES